MPMGMSPQSMDETGGGRVDSGMRWGGRVSGSRVEVWRGPLVESRHRVSVAVVDGGGRMRACAGDPTVPVFARSSAKPIQALPLAEDGVLERFGMGDRELALACASHSGEPRHVSVATAMLRRIGLDDTSLACGPQEPFHEASARSLRSAGQPAGRIHNNCSGKHAGMLALARSHGWMVAGYQEASHPVQERMLVEVARWTELPESEIQLGTDGCGVVTFGVPLVSLAGAFARLAAAARRGDPGPSRVVRAMTTYPELVGGTGRLCTDLMRAGGGRILAKTGAEGMYCAGVPGAELGVAIKVEDGAKRASGPALLGVLRELGLLAEEEMAELESHANPDVVNTRGEIVGRIRASIELEPGS